MLTVLQIRVCVFVYYIALIFCRSKFLWFLRIWCPFVKNISPKILTLRTCVWQDGSAQVLQACGCGVSRVKAKWPSRSALQRSTPSVISMTNAWVSWHQLQGIDMVTTYHYIDLESWHLACNDMRDQSVHVWHTTPIMCGCGLLLQRIHEIFFNKIVKNSNSWKFRPAKYMYKCSIWYVCMYVCTFYIDFIDHQAIVVTPSRISTPSVSLCGITSVYHTSKTSLYKHVVISMSV